jgi:hypothetical protein
LALSISHFVICRLTIHSSMMQIMLAVFGAHPTRV